MLTFLCFLAVGSARPTWYGPVTASFPTQFAGNPYDPAVNDVHVRFTDDRGRVEDRVAYFSDGAFRAVLVAKRAAKWKAQLVRNGVVLGGAPTEGTLETKAKLPHGFVRVDPILKTRFAYDDGTPYVPIGMNQAWGDGKPGTIVQAIRRMNASGLTWSRIWSASWDRKNAWWPQGDAKVPEGELWPEALENWGAQVDGISRTDVAFQFVLHNHGTFSTTVNPNWPDHPWNASKGGFLKNVSDFFTDPEAKRRTKMWLRYAVARYAWSPNVMSWELFNEVEGTDAGRDGRWKEIAEWHREMATYIRQLDPYDHLVTTSSVLDHPELYASMDYVQPHTYPASVLAAVMSCPLPTDKPLFFGEFGPPDGTPDQVREGVRDGVYGGLFAGHAGAAQYWYWDRADQAGITAQLSVAARVIYDSHWGMHPRAHPGKLLVKSDFSSPLVIAPGMGWAASTIDELNLPADATPEKLGQLSSYFQSETGGNKAMAKPLSIRFVAKAPGEATLVIGEKSAAGGSLAVRVNGATVVDKIISGPMEIKVPYAAGSVQIALNNRGADWFRIERISIPDLSSGGQAWQLTEGSWGMVRLKSDRKSATFGVDGLQLVNGRYKAEVIDAVTGAEEEEEYVQVKNGHFNWTAESTDTILILTRA